MIVMIVIIIIIIIMVIILNGLDWCRPRRPAPPFGAP